MKEMEWYENEKENFESWLVLEKKSWETVRQTPYEEVFLGLRKEDMFSIWQRDLYETLYEKEKNWTYFYTHMWRKQSGDFYFVDFEENGYEFHLDLTIIDEVFSSEVFMKKKGEENFYSMNDHLLFDIETKERKNLLDSVLSVYEKTKECILNRTNYRLRLLTGVMVQHEKKVEQLKDYYGTL